MKLPTTDSREQVKGELFQGELNIYAFVLEKFAFHFKQRRIVRVLKTQAFRNGEKLFVIWLGHVEDKRAEPGDTRLVDILDFKQLAEIDPEDSENGSQEQDERCR